MTRPFNARSRTPIMALGWMALCTQVEACEPVIHVGSYHTDRTAIDNPREFNPGLGCRWGHVEVGGYVNSYSDHTAYIVADTHTDGFSAFIGLASGYQDDAYVPDHGITPVFGLAYHSPNTSTRIAPTYNRFKRSAGVVFAFSLTLEATR